MKKKIVMIASILTIPMSIIPSDDQPIFGKTFYNPRSQGSYTSRSAVGFVDLINRYDRCNFYTSWGITGEFAQTFDTRGLGIWLFFNGDSAMFFGNAANPGVDVFGQNFLLNNDFEGIVATEPKVTNILADFEWYLSFNQWFPNWYFRLHTPMCESTWNMELKQNVEAVGSVIPANSLGNPADAPAPFDTIISAWNGNATFFDVKKPLEFAKISLDLPDDDEEILSDRTKQAFADVEMALGYNIILDECSHFGLNVRAIIPTGNRPTGRFLFEPIVGNCHLFEFGFGIDGHLELWNNGDNQLLSAYLIGNVYHMFSSKQRRSFDLSINGPGSRYLLFKRFESGAYAGEIVRGPNILTLGCKVHNDVHVDASFMLHYRYCGLTLEAGYNVWARTKDKITDIELIPQNTYGIAGTSGTGVNSNKTASKTTISGLNADLLDDTIIYLANKDINVNSAAHPNVFAHGFFGYAGYTFDEFMGQDYTRYEPFIGIGSQVEFSGRQARALKMWHVWAKCGFIL